jgi:alpha-ketoglutarate-dependent taurine dioxygenase
MCELIKKSKQTIDYRVPTFPVDFSEKDQEKALKQNGHIYLSNLPPDFNWKSYTQRFTKTQLMPQDSGELIYHVKSVPGHEQQSDSKSQNELRVHTEASYLSLPPKYLALWCVQPAQCGGGFTTLADGEEFLRTLTEQEQKLLLKPRYKFANKDRTRKITAPILEFYQHKLMFRFSFNILAHDNPSPNISTKATISDPFLKDICHRFVKFFEDRHIAVRMEKNSLLIWDNYRMLHARTKYSDSSRHLERIWLT